MCLSSLNVSKVSAARTLRQVWTGSCQSIHSSCGPGSTQPQNQAVSASNVSSDPCSSASASAEPGGSLLRKGQSTGGRRLAPHSSASRKKRQPALLRFDPDHPLISSLAPAPAQYRNVKVQKLPQWRAKRLSQLHVALQTGSADIVWSAYRDLRQSHQGVENALSLNESTASENIMTPEEYRDILNIISNEATKTKRGLNRMMRLVSDVRTQQRHLLTRLQHASEANDEALIHILTKELEAWDTIVSPKLLNATIRHIGRSLRSVGLEEIDLVLDQLLTYEANEHSRMRKTTFKAKPSKRSSASYSMSALDNLHAVILSSASQSALDNRRGVERNHSEFPDLATYNTILDIITRMVHRSNPGRRSVSQEGHAHDEEDDAMAKFTIEHLALRSAQINALLATKLRRFDLDPNAVPLHLDALQRADRLFHSVLERMQKTSRIEPDAITFNIMVSMYCLLDRWEAVQRVIRVMHNRNILDIDCINNALAHWLIRGPRSVNRHGSGDDWDGMAIDSAFEVYRQLRQNLVHVELHHSAVAYGHYDAYSQEPDNQDEDVLSSRDEMGPLMWPDHNESLSTDSLRRLTPSSRNDAISQVLGLSRLPLGLVPDEITHSLIINSLTREGRFADALSVFKDLVSTPIRLSAKRRGDVGTEIADGNAAVEHTEESKMQPTLAIFVSFFRGFSRHGRPSMAVAFDAEYPERTTWEPVVTRTSEDVEEDAPHAEQLQLWKIETFQEIFDAFLDFEPDVSQVVSSDSSDRGLNRHNKFANRNISSPLGWLTLAEKRKLDALRRAPSSNQLFWILTAIRRVSHDHAGWSLAMWRKVLDKFARVDTSSSASCEQTGSLGELGWTGFKVDNRLRRVLEHLETRSVSSGSTQDEARGDATRS